MSDSSDSESSLPPPPPPIYSTYPTFYPEEKSEKEYPLPPAPQTNASLYLSTVTPKPFISPPPYCPPPSSPSLKADSAVSQDRNKKRLFSRPSHFSHPGKGTGTAGTFYASFKPAEDSDKKISSPEHLNDQCLQSNFIERDQIICRILQIQPTTIIYY